MPELAEVDFHRRRWDPGIGKRIRAVRLHPRARIFRDESPRRVRRLLEGRILRGSETRGKQILFRFSGPAWLGIHLGISGQLRLDRPRWAPDKHDHFVLVQAGQALVFRDPRLFGRVRIVEGRTPPVWWTELPPEILSPEFTFERVAGFLRRRKKSAIKSVLLMQECFPGVGNWMADEVLWRAGIYPKTPAGRIGPVDVRRLWRMIRHVSRLAMKIVAPAHDDPPDTWLFRHRWNDGARCPRTGVQLRREKIGGRTTCWSPALQPEPTSPQRSRAARRGKSDSD